MLQRAGVWGGGWMHQLGNLQTLILAMRSRRQFFPEEVVASVLLDLASGEANPSIQTPCNNNHLGEF
jgi:hypothetical protein